MRLLFVADGRSPIAIQWMRYFSERGDKVHLASTFPCKTDLALEQLEIVPVAFSSVKRDGGNSRPAGLRTVKLRSDLRAWFGLLTMPLAARKLRRIIRNVKPDLVHAMRIPYEGMLAATAAGKAPLAISVWGNDFTLHAVRSREMERGTRKTLNATHGLHTDCARDLKLALERGFDEGKPVFIAPGNGGIRSEVFYPASVAAQEPIVFNPRGIRTYVRSESFFKAIPLILAHKPETIFVCAAMAGEPLAKRWISDLNLPASVRLLDPMPHEQMGEYYRQAQVLVSPSVHDGTPNSLLEGMACGCFPVAGNLESIREWITHGRNGLLVDANDPASIAEAVLTALGRADLRADAAAINAQMIATRADYKRNMELAREFYGRVIFTA